MTSLPPRLLALDTGLVAEARALAHEAVAPVVDFCDRHTTVSVERAIARLLGLSGADATTAPTGIPGAPGVPLANLLVDRVAAAGHLGRGVAVPSFVAAARKGVDVAEAMALLATGQLPVPPSWTADEAIAARAAGASAATAALARIDARRAERDRWLGRLADPAKPWIYLIVATGDIDEDVVQAQAAARQGADVIAVIRSTGQSLLDFVPEGETHDGFAGTYATEANFRKMRRALDEVSEELGRYVRLTNYASGLCMPEIAVMAALERLDMMLNDCMYGTCMRSYSAGSFTAVC